MTSRTIHSGASFAIVLVAYWSYALLAVPWIEPPPRGSTIDIDSKDLPTRPHITDDLKILFPPDSWQLQNTTNVFDNNGQAKLLWQTYKNLGNGWVDLKPLTIIFMPDETVADSVERWRHAVVMDIPEGANLRFDRPLGLSTGGIGRLIEGRLRGPVLVRSQGKRPDQQDDLDLRTHDVDLTEQRITTASDVDFQWGRNSGRGRQMEIKLLPRLGPRVTNQEGPNIGGIEQIQFEHVERLHLDMGSGSTAAAQGGPGAPARGSPPPGLGALSAHDAPVDITCRGPFRFNLIEQKATFRNQVDVQRIQPNGPCDRMGCELLSIFFARPAPHAGAAPPPKQGAPGFDLQPARIEAQGTPTTLTAPLDHLQVRAEILRYNVTDGQIYLADTQEVVLQKDRSEIHTPSLRYTPGPPNHTGQFQLLAAGPGWLRGEMAAQPGQPPQAAGPLAQPGQQLEAHWREKLEVRPQDQNQVISLLGGAKLNFPAMGQLDAKDIHFWLHELLPSPSGRGAASTTLPSPSGRGAASTNFPSPSGRGAGGEGGFQPDRLLAEGNVVGSSPQFSTKVERLEAWFTNAAPAGNGTTGTNGTNATNDARERLSGSAAPAPYVPSTTPLAPAPAISQSPLAPLGGQDPAAVGGRQAHMEISGRLLQARILLRDQQRGELTEVTVVDNVKLQETQTALPGDLPLLVTGQWLHATEASSLQAKVTVRGAPAHLEGRGMGLTGSNIQIDRGANVLAMEGPGRMEKALDRDEENRPLSQPGAVKIQWQKGMVFDGRKAHFQDAVNARFQDSANVAANSRLLVTGSLDVYFQQPISFSDTRQQQSPSTVARLVCGDGVYVENRTVEAGQQVAYDRIELKTLDLNNITGDFQGAGPGRLIHVFRGDGQGRELGAGSRESERPLAPRSPLPAPVPPATSASNQLTGIRLRFLRSLTGNKIRKDLMFHGQVRAAYAPVQSWDATLDSDSPKDLDPQAVVLRCDNLAVNDMSPVSGGHHVPMVGGRNLEMTALDNVIIEGASFLARSARATYTPAKDLAILEGDGRSDAELFQQEGGEGTQVSRFAAQKILYFIKTKQINADGMRSFQHELGPGAAMPPKRR